MGEEIHRNHRKRMLQKFREHGLDSFHDHEVLEMLLYFAIPRIDTNPMAHRLLNRFNSIHGVLDAPIQQLMDVKGIGLNAATLIKLMCALVSRYETSLAKKNMVKFTDRSVIANYFIPKFMGKTNEVLLAAFLDGQGRLICCEELCQGSATTVSFNQGHIVRRAVINNAAAVVLAHNHPGGRAEPSVDDITQNHRVRGFLREIGIQLFAHCIVADNEAVFIDREAEHYMLGETGYVIV